MGADERPCLIDKCAPESNLSVRPIPWAPELARAVARRLPVSVQINIRDVKIVAMAMLDARSLLTDLGWTRPTAWREAYGRSLETIRILKSRYPGTYRY